MHGRPFIAAAVLALGASVTGEAAADYILYPIPGTGVAIVLEGQVGDVRSGGSVSLRTQFGNLYFRLREDLGSRDFIIRVPTAAERYTRDAAKARSISDPHERAGALFTVGKEALRRGLRAQFYEAVERTVESDPDHKLAIKLLAERKRLDQPLPDNNEAMVELKKLLGREMQLITGPHFALLYDTPPDVARKRLDLLEQVYETFLMYFWSMGVERVHVPSERMRVVLFNKYTDFKSFAVSLSPSLQGAAGFWDPKRNVSVFFAYGSREEFAHLQKVAAEAAALARRVRDGDIARMAKSLQLVTRIAQENHDIEVVSHEATHQMAGNTGLLPAEVRVPSWVHEGLATFFESPDDASWSGIGAVNERRLDWFRGLASNQRQYSRVDFVVGDEIFDLAASHGSLLHAYGQSWALTHYLMTERFDEMMKYYDLLAQLPPDMIFSPKILRRCFVQAFGKNTPLIDAQWHAYMSAQKTDLEKVLGRALSH
jgi:hypothetical protein